MRHDELGELLIKRLRGSGLNTRIVARLTGVSQKTVDDDWLRQGRAPRGETLNRLWHLLALAGVDSPEFTTDFRGKELNLYVGQLLAFGVVTMEEAQIICGGVASQAVLDAIRGQRSLANPAYTVKQLHEEICNHAQGLTYEQQLQETMAAIRQELTGEVILPASPSVLAPNLAPHPSQLEQSDRTPPSDIDPRLEQVILELSQRLGGLLPALRHMLSDRVTKEERGYLRSLVGGSDYMLKLTNAMMGLVSERARDHYLNEQQDR